MNNKTLAELFTQKFIDRFSESERGMVEDERNVIIKLVRELIEQFPFLAKLDLANMSLDEILELVFEYIELCHQYSIFDDPDFIEFYFKLNKKSSFTAFMEMYLMMIIMSQMRDTQTEISLVFDKNDLMEFDVDDIDSFKLIRDNSVHLYCEDTLKHRFIMSVETAVIYAAKHISSIDPLFKNGFNKFSSKPNALDFLKGDTGCNLEKYPEPHRRTNAIKNKLIESGSSDYVITVKNSTFLVKKPKV